MKFLFAALLPIVTQAQGNLPRDVSAVYSYQCTGNFLEGEGISPYAADCPANQRLGFIRAKHTAYLFVSEQESNAHRQKTSEAYSSSICERQVMRLVCDSPKTLEFGLSRKAEGIFQTKVILSPDFSDNTQVYGYAAQPESNGGCPAGLVKARFYEARPASITSPLPTSFANEYGSQNDRVLHIEGSRFPFFAVHRLANTKPCDGFGRCGESTVGEPSLAQVTAYEPVENKGALCVVPGGAIER
jgi:hypothetical protein